MSQQTALWQGGDRIASAVLRPSDPGHLGMLEDGCSTTRLVPMATHLHLFPLPLHMLWPLCKPLFYQLQVILQSRNQVKSLEGHEKGTDAVRSISPAGLRHDSAWGGSALYSKAHHSYTTSVGPQVYNTAG